MNMTVENQDKYRYSALQVAVNKFGKSLHQLSPNKRREAEDIAFKQYQIQSRILAAPEASQISIPREQLDNEIEKVISRYANEDQFYRELHENALSIAAFRNSIDRELRVHSVMDLVTSNTEPCSETDARLYYYLHPEKFIQPELRDAYHILITINPDYPENKRDAALKRAGVIAKRLQRKPAKFAEQALKYSECPTAMQNGHLGLIKRGTLFPTLDKALFSMKAGEVSDVLESPLGFHVLYCASIEKKGLVPLGKALPTIMEKLTERNKQNHLRAWIKKVCESK